MAVRAILLGLALALASGGPAPAEDQPAESNPLVITVHPSRFEAGEGARERQQRLSRRARELDFAFRSICIGCAAVVANAPAAGSAFHPFNALVARPKKPAIPDESPAAER